MTRPLDGGARVQHNRAMRWLPDIRYGTARYPEAVARRLRAVNITAWIAASLAFTFAVMQATQDFDRLKWPALVNFADALIWASLPRLHRFGPLAATLTFGATVYASNFALSALLGTGAGIGLYYFAAATLVVLFIGVERVVVAAIVAALGAILYVVSELALPERTGLLPPDQMRFNFIASAVGATAILFGVVFYAVRQIARAEAAAEREYRRSEALLVNILPPPIATRLKAGAGVIADNYAAASILFADIAGFTARSADTPPAELVHFLNRLYGAFDRVVERYGLEKIKTSGDAYMVVSGVPVPRPDHAEAMARCALDLLAAAAQIRDAAGRSTSIRIGINSGPVVAGVVGTKKFFYDVWGDAVNVAARMEQTGVVGRIQVSAAAQARLAGRFALEPRGEIEIRGKGMMQTWFLAGERPPGSAA